MTRRITTLLLLGLAVLVVSDQAFAGPLRRIRQRRTAQLRAELSADVTAQVGDAAEELRTDLDKQFQTETEKLEAEVEKELAGLRKLARELVAQEAQTLKKQVAAQVEELRNASKTIVQEEAKRLEQQVSQEVAKMQQLADQQIETAVAKMELTVKEKAVELEKAAATHNEKLKTDLTAMIESRLAKDDPPVDDSDSGETSPNVDAIEPKQVGLESGDDQEGTPED